ncbi:MAG: putative pyridoxal phosphate-dependent acyltransferase [Candidatus Heimdallarchaeota archaeon LC_3]|nr:MAG: putative pyridoxal phosphate-dependent acyltransferase [Candidatus Heimdallarchaeota archaeon LC_3]
MSNDPTAFMVQEYQDLVEKQLDWQHKILQGPSTAECVVEGKKVLMLCSNNYLGLSYHPKLIEAAKKSLDTHGAGSGSVRAIAGNMDLHEILEKKFADFKEQEGVMITQSGYAANAGVIPQLAPAKEDYILSDELNHGSIIDGVRLSKAKKGVYKHNDMNSLEEKIREIDKLKPRRILLVTDGVFSMDGDYTKLDELQKIVEPYGVIIWVDDAHGDFVLGSNKSGKGIVDHFKLQNKIHVEMNTFSKGAGTVGGAITGSKSLVSWARNKTRTYLLSGSHPPPVVAASIAALEVVQEEPLVSKLWDNIDYFKKEIINLGFDHEITQNSKTAILPVILGENEVAREFSNRLFNNGIFALPIVFPMVPKGTARIRVMMNATLSKIQLNQSLSAFDKVGKELKVL